MRYILALLLILYACPASAAPAKLQVLASFSIIEDIAKQVGGEHVEVTSLIPRNTDPHNFEPTPADVKKVKQADVIIINGLGFEPWMERLKEASKTKADIIEATFTVKALPSDEKDDDHDHGAMNPHAWHSFENGAIYARNIANAFAAKDPHHANYYSERLIGYLARMEELKSELQQKIVLIPSVSRRFAVTHNTFAYYAKAYNFTIISPQGLSTESEPSAMDVANVIKDIRANGIRAIFTENTARNALMEEIAREAGATIGGKLYTDALSEPNGEAGTYFAMMRYNTEKICDALKRK